MDILNYLQGMAVQHGPQRARGGGVRLAEGAL